MPLSVFVFRVFFASILLASAAFAGEGFFKKEQLKLGFSLDAKERAAVFVEEKKDSGWKHGGNAFYVSKHGYMITNQHIAFNCVRDNRAYFMKRYKNMQDIFDKGFVAPAGDTVLCRTIRVTDDPRSGKVKQVAIVAFPPVETINKLADFAILKVIDDEPKAWLELKDLADLEVGADVYCAGYPYITDRAEKSKLVRDGVYADVKPGDYRVAVGKVLPFKEGYYDPDHKDKFYYTDTDGGQGSSGSALLDAKGNLVALILGSGDDTSSIINNCIPKLEYCGGTVRYLRIGFMVKKMQEHFPDLLKRL